MRDSLSGDAGFTTELDLESKATASEAPTKGDKLNDEGHTEES